MKLLRDFLFRHFAGAVSRVRARKVNARVRVITVPAPLRQEHDEKASIAPPSCALPARSTVAVAKPAAELDTTAPERIAA